MGKVTQKKVLIITNGGNMLSCKINDCLLSKEPQPNNATNMQEGKKMYHHTTYHLYLKDAKQERIDHRWSSLGGDAGCPPVARGSADDEPSSTATGPTR